MMDHAAAYATPVLKKTTNKTEKRLHKCQEKMEQALWVRAREQVEDWGPVAAESVAARKEARNVAPGLGAGVARDAAEVWDKVVAGGRARARAVAADSAGADEAGSSTGPTQAMTLVGEYVGAAGAAMKVGL